VPSSASATAGGGSDENILLSLSQAVAAKDRRLLRAAVKAALEAGVEGAAVDEAFSLLEVLEEERRAAKASRALADSSTNSSSAALATLVEGGAAQSVEAQCAAAVEARDKAALRLALRRAEEEGIAGAVVEAATACLHVVEEERRVLRALRKAVEVEPVEAATVQAALGAAQDLGLEDREETRAAKKALKRLRKAEQQGASE